jgi:hypothetical protein
LSGLPQRYAPDQAEIDSKAPAWLAFSNLFLDTELQPDDLSRLASQLHATGISTNELRSILENEVAPALASNLFLDIAGEWSAFANDYVIERIVDCMKSGPPLLLPMKQVRSYCEAEWAKLLPLFPGDRA